MKKIIYSLASLGLFLFLLVACGGDDSGFNNATTRDSSSGGNVSGKGGSMARFAVNGDHLFTVDENNLRVFDISNAAKPKQQNTIPLTFGVETIFPYKNNLFIGTRTGMYIYDVQNPASPVQLSHYQHVFSCDPVAVNDDYAFVTLRSGTDCRTGTNRMEIVDIEDLRNPRMIKQYPMKSPKGLGIDSNMLFVCDDGLKVYNTNDVTNLQLTEHFLNIDTYDVIPVNGNLLMVASDGFYQYSYAGGTLQLLSKIPVN